VAAGVFFSGLPVCANAELTESSRAQTNPMKSVDSKAPSAAFDFAASPLSETRAVPFNAVAPSNDGAAGKQSGERLAEKNDGPVVIPLPPAAWTGAAGLVVLIGWLAFRRVRHPG
jgi:hypothetical protein